MERPAIRRSAWPAEYRRPAARLGRSAFPFHPHNETPTRPGYRNSRAVRIVLLGRHVMRLYGLSGGRGGGGRVSLATCQDGNPTRPIKSARPKRAREQRSGQALRTAGARRGEQGALSRPARGVACWATRGPGRRSKGSQGRHNPSLFPIAPHALPMVATRPARPSRVASPAWLPVCRTEWAFSPLEPAAPLPAAPHGGAFAGSESPRRRSTLSALIITIVWPIDICAPVGSHEACRMRLPRLSGKFNVEYGRTMARSVTCGRPYYGGPVSDAKPWAPGKPSDTAAAAGPCTPAICRRSGCPMRSAS